MLKRQALGTDNRGGSCQICRQYLKKIRVCSTLHMLEIPQLFWFEDSFVSQKIYLRCFEEARTLDPRFAEAYAREALSHLRVYWFGPSSARLESLIKAIEDARKCADLDDELAACKCGFGISIQFRGT